MLALVLLLLTAAPASAAPAWSAPVPGHVVRPYAYDRARPFAAGWRRGVELAAPPGAAVVAPCSGVAVTAGPAPRGRGVGLRCGGVRATVLGLAVVRPRPGARVRAGQELGRAGASGSVWLSARAEDDRLAYRDPLALVARRGPPPPLPGLGPAPRERHPPVRAPLPAARPSGGPARAPAPLRAPLAAWLGAALLALALPGGALVRARRRRATRAPGRARVAR